MVNNFELSKEYQNADMIRTGELRMCKYKNVDIGVILEVRIKDEMSFDYVGTIFPDEKTKGVIVMIDYQKYKKYKDFMEKMESEDVNYPFFDRDAWTPMFEALGDDENEIIEFMDNADSDTLSDIYTFWEKLEEKFPSEKMSKAIQSFL
ncbi:hypothetical protein [Anaeromassilibacillus sp. An172]|uniref:hypothetical protein n=1 Tax=Anaeromassilibacillus sp. An172 TaxID=1965570 RepID=UPI001177906C|nr:hypothetical protein [Anaeromassilibacillus sp. An172]